MEHAILSDDSSEFYFSNLGSPVETSKYQTAQKPVISLFLAGSHIKQQKYPWRICWVTGQRRGLRKVNENKNYIACKTPFGAHSKNNHNFK